MDGLTVVVVVVVGPLIWLVADLQYDRRWSWKRAELGAQNRWKELNAHFEAHLASHRPLLRLARYETHQAAGRAYLLLGGNEAALAELQAAAQLALHPLEKHATNY